MFESIPIIREVFRVLAIEEVNYTCECKAYVSSCRAEMALLAR